MAKSVWQQILDIPKRLRRSTPVVTVVRLSGPIGFTTPLSPGMTLASAAKTLERAFSVKQAKTVAIAINSPGGSPVQSHLIHQRIRALAEEHKKKVIVFIEDVAASGGYMIACAGDEIYADAASITGSIGVVSAGFGFHKLLGKIGVDRRVYTAGDRKMILDPFQPEDAEDVKRLKSAQKEVHGLFISLVKERRGKKLKGTDKILFSGEFWIGAEAEKLGLIDGIGELRGVLRERFGKKVSIRFIAPPQSWFRQRVPGIGREAVQGWADDLISSLEARALWARYGL